MSERQLILELPVRPALGREDFLVAPCNADAIAWLDRWPAWPERMLLVHGPEGAGKSHLAQVWRHLAAARDMPVGELAAASPPPLRSGEAVSLDDVDSALADGAAETALLHLVNYVREGGGGLLLTARRPPARWPVRLADLRSRLLAAPAVGIGPPDEELLTALLAKFFHERQIHVSGEVIRYLLSRIERSFAAARRTAAALDAAALRGKRPITVPLARQVLESGSRPGGA